MADDSDSKDDELKIAIPLDHKTQILMNGIFLHQNIFKKNSIRLSPKQQKNCGLTIELIFGHCMTYRMQIVTVFELLSKFAGKICYAKAGAL